MNDDNKNKKLCDGCTTCCEHISLEIDEPETKEDFSNLFWYLLHENVTIFIDNDECWMLEFKTKCRALKTGGLCDVYETRPDICKTYDQDTCEKYGEGTHYYEKFTTRKELSDWILNNTDLGNLL